MIDIQTLLWENQKHIVHFKTILELAKKPLPIEIELSPGNIKWGSKIPFWYGDFPHHINPVDNMGWDIILIKNPEIKQTIQGVVCIDPDANKIPPPHGNKPGNHKLILSDKQLNKIEKEMINKFFINKPSFSSPIYFDEKTVDKFLEENWEKSIMNGYKLGHMKDAISTSIAVGPTSRKQFGVSTSIFVPNKAKTK